MARIECYNRRLGCASLAEVAERFMGSLTATNRTFEFYVDWGKVTANVEQYTTELSVLNSLLRLPPESVEERFQQLIAEFPGVLRVLPLLFAERAESIEVLARTHDGALEVLLFDFTPRILTQSEVERITYFAREVGLLDLFKSRGIFNLVDYLLGVEVGMDTNARKNRSGTAMEDALYPSVREAALLAEAQVHRNVRIDRVPELEGLSVPPALASRRLDFLVVHGTGKGRKILNIETNYFSRGGSKQEVVDAYIQRQTLLREMGADFALVTDGQGWVGNGSLLRRALEVLDWLMNLDFVNRGMLKDVILGVDG